MTVCVCRIILCATSITGVVQTVNTVYQPQGRMGLTRSNIVFLYARSDCITSQMLDFIIPILCCDWFSLSTEWLQLQYSNCTVALLSNSPGISGGFNWYNKLLRSGIVACAQSEYRELKPCQ